MTYRWRFSALLIVMVFALMLAGCGGDDDGGDSANTTNGGDAGTVDTSTTNPDAPTPVRPTNTPYPPPPRERAEPTSEPHDFEPPFSVGDFVRQSLRGNATAVTAGGQQAIYKSGTSTIVLKIYHFNLTANAIATVEDTLNAPTIVAQVSDVYTSPAVNFGVVQDQHGAYIAAWNNYRWAFIATSPDSLDALNTFLDIFQY